MDIAFSEKFFWKLHKILAETSAFNQASARLLEKFGFKLDGRVRDHYWLEEKAYDQLIFTLLKSDYKNGK